MSTPALPLDDADWALRRETQAVPSQADRLVREVLAFLVCAGIGPSTRARVAGACAEVLDNVCRHAYVDGPGRVWLEAELGDRELALTISDDGLGLDPLAVQLAAQQHSGLDRAAALAESLELSGEPGRGTAVTLTFSVYRVDFDEDPTLDLSELDYLPPDLARRVTEALSGPDQGVSLHLSPALAVTVGRLLAATTVDRSAHAALWS